MFRAVSAAAPWLFRRGIVNAGFLLIFAALGASAYGEKFTTFSFAPEVDPGSLHSAMTLLVGSALLVLGRRSKK